MFKMFYLAEVPIFPLLCNAVLWDSQSVLTVVLLLQTLLVSSIIPAHTGKAKNTLVLFPSAEVEVFL